ncbi:hypothetical protein [Hyphobacterium sp.]|uniref:hypothetical protein n=1 Tax=Hyphobacterium sp. TaxID=2004662 RepID=UPI003BAA3C0E
MFRSLAVLFLTAMLSACASVQYAMGPQLISTERVTERSYELNEPVTTVVGNSMIRVRDYRRDVYSGDRVEVQQPFSINGPVFNHDFQIGESFEYGGLTVLNDEEMEFFWFGSYGIVYNQIGQVQDKILNANAGGPPVFMIYTFQTNSGAGSVERANSEQISNTPDGQNYQIIFSGIDGSSIRLNYREFTDNDLARQAFYQELTYPVGAETIRFRDLELAVHEVSADQITFSVIGHSEN